MADLDLVGRPRQAIAAILALAALDETGIAQFAKDGVEKFLRDVVAGRDIADESQLPGRHVREVDQRLEAVLAFLVSIDRTFLCPAMAGPSLRNAWRASPPRSSIHDT